MVAPRLFPSSNGNYDYAPLLSIAEGGAVKMVPKVSGSNPVELVSFRRTFDLDSEVE